MRISIYNALGDFRDLSFDRAGIHLHFFFFLDSIGKKQIIVGFFTYTYRIPDRNNLVLLDIDHCILFHKSCIILKCHKVSRLPGNVKQQRESRPILQVLYLSFCRCHRRILDRTCHRIILCLHSSLVHQNKSHIGLVTIYRSYSRVHPYIIINRQIIISVCCLQTIFLAEYTVKIPML